MCNPGLWAMAIGTAIQMGENRKATKRQEGVMNRMEGNQDQINTDVLNVIRRNMGQYEPQNRMEARQEQEQEARGTFDDALGDAFAKGRQIYSGKPIGRVSDVYEQQAGQREAATEARMGDVSALLSKYLSPYDLRANENLENLNAANKVGGLVNYGQTLRNAGQVDLQRAGRRNPYHMAVGSGLQSYGANKASS